MKALIVLKVILRLLKGHGTDKHQQTRKSVNSHPQQLSSMKLNCQRITPRPGLHALCSIEPHTSRVFVSYTQLIIVEYFKTVCATYCEIDASENTLRSID